MLASVATGRVEMLSHEAEGHIGVRVGLDAVERFEVGDVVAVVALSSLEVRAVAADVLRAAQAQGVEVGGSVLRSEVEGSLAEGV